MTPKDIGKAYDRIAEFWDGDRFDRENGIAAHRKAMRMAPEGGRALDIGCGCSGRFFDLLRESGYNPEGVDVSQDMVRRAKLRHPDIEIAWANFVDWESGKLYSLITAWDSIWHLNIEGQIQAIKKASSLLDTRGVFIFTAELAEHPAEHKSLHGTGPVLWRSWRRKQLLELLIRLRFAIEAFRIGSVSRKAFILIAQKTG